MSRTPEAETVFIGLGSNLGDSKQHLTKALDSLATLPTTRLEQLAPWYRSKAIGPGTQRDYLNGVAKLRTALSALQLLGYLQEIEHQCGRERTVRWGARTLDLDLLLYGQQTINSSKLVVPHPRLLERAFVLFPLNDVAPGLLLPDGTSIAETCSNCDNSGLERLAGFGF